MEDEGPITVIKQEACTVKEEACIDEDLDLNNLYQSPSSQVETSVEFKDGDDEDLELNAVQEPYCELCGFVFTSINEARTHMEEHTNDDLAGEEEDVLECELEDIDVVGYDGDAVSSHVEISSETKNVVDLTSEEFDDPVTCDICLESFMTEERLKKHRKTHDSVVEFLNSHLGIAKEEVEHCCQVCGKVCFEAEELEIHLRVHSGEKPFKCRICSKSFPQQSSLRSHFRIHAGEPLYECDDCGKGYNRASLLARHRRSHKKKKPNYECDVCGDLFYTMPPLIIHRRKHDNDSRSAFPHLGGFPKSRGGYRVDGSLKSGERTHGNKTERRRSKPVSRVTSRRARKHGCKLCGKHFRQAHDLLIHTRVHTGEKPFECKVCFRSFSQRGTLRSHLKTHNQARPFTCRQCGESFAQFAALEEHEDSHLKKEYSETSEFSQFGDSTMECIVEDYEENVYPESRNGSLSLIHGGQEQLGQYSCEVCGVLYARLHNLLKHRKTHDDDNRLDSTQPKSPTTIAIPQAPHCSTSPEQSDDDGDLSVCKVCQMLFNNRGALRRHVDAYCGRKQYSCQECGKGFHQTHDLKLHVRVHTGERPHRCRYCNWSFSQKSSLDCHLRTHTGEKPYYCSECDKSFTRRDTLRKHQKTHER